MNVGVRQPEAAVRPAMNTRRRARLPRFGRDWAVRLASIVLVLIAWQVYSGQVSPIFLRSPIDVLAAFGRMLQDGSLQAATVDSLRNLAIGLALAIVLGLGIGLGSARSWLAYNAVNPWLTALYSTPSVALVPFLSLWLGIGDTAKVAVIVLFSIFPIIVNTQQGVKYVDPQLLEVARAFSSSERRLWTDVLWPGALPYIFAGIRLAIPRALVGMILAEFLISVGRGLGSLILIYQNTFQVDRMFVPVIVVAAMGVALIALMNWLERRLAPWARRE